MTDLRLALLGPPLVERDGAPVTFDTKKAIALLAFLAVTAREQTRERLTLLLWPDSDEARARGSLRRTLSVTVAAMGEGLAVSRRTVALRPEQVQLDVADFETYAARSDMASLEQAARLYRDDLLAGFSVRGCPEFDDWQSAAADSLRRSLAGVLERLVTACADEGELQRALGHAERWLSLDRLHEPAHQALIRLLGMTGQRSAASRQYRDLVVTLDRELAVRPLPETTRLYDEVRAGGLEPARPRPARPAVMNTAHATWPLLGRAAELRSFDDRWRAVAAGRPGHGGVVAVVGEAGTGKTTLITAFRHRVVESAGRALTARCHEGESDLPFALPVDLLRSAIARQPGLPAQLPRHVAETVATLVPEVVPDRSGQPHPVASPADLTRLYAAIGATLLAAVRVQDDSAVPDAGMIVAEDIHWADSRSLDFLAYLTRRLASWPALLVLSWRPEGASRLRSAGLAVAEAMDAGYGALSEIGPLGQEYVGQLLQAAGLPHADLAQMMRQTRGNPMLVREYAEALRSGRADAGSPQAEAAAVIDASQGWPTPDSVRALLNRRLAAVSEPTRQMLSTAAVLGSACDVDLLRNVSGRGESETVTALDEAVSRLLLTEVPASALAGAPRYEFPYEALRTAAYESATHARRRLLHSRAADTLARRHGRVRSEAHAAVIADHLQHAGRDEESARWWWRAAESARRLYSHAEALAHLRQAAALGYSQAETGVAIGDALTALGRYTEALADYEMAAGAAGHDPALVATVENKLADVHHRLGDWHLADTHLAAAAALIESSNLAGQAKVAADRAVVAYRLGAAEQARVFGHAALDGAERAGDETVIAEALNVLGMLAARDGDFVLAENWLRASLRRARSIADPAITVAALNNLARLLADSGRAAEALHLAEEALALGSELGDRHRIAALHTNLADLLHATGRGAEAVDHLKEAARKFAAVDAGDLPRPEIWMLVDW